jgi:serine/threonine protein kinase
MTGHHSDNDLPSISEPGFNEDRGPSGDVPHIEGYKIAGPLGQGGMGTVWRAVQISTRRQVALKVLGRGALASEKALARFEREVELTARLQHPNIARI